MKISYIIISFILYGNLLLLNGCSDQINDASMEPICFSGRIITTRGTQLTSNNLSTMGEIAFYTE